MFRDISLLKHIKKNRLLYGLFIVFIVAFFSSIVLLSHKNKISETFGGLLLFGDFIFGCVVIYMFRLCRCCNNNNASDFQPYVENNEETHFDEGLLYTYDVDDIDSINIQNTDVTTGVFVNDV